MISSKIFSISEPLGVGGHDIKPSQISQKKSCDKNTKIQSNFLIVNFLIVKKLPYSKHFAVTDLVYCKEVRLYQCDVLKEFLKSRLIFCLITVKKFIFLPYFVLWPQNSL